MTDVKEWLKENPIDVESDVSSLMERVKERGEALREEWEGREPETKDEALAIMKPAMKEMANDLVKTVTRMLVKQVVKTAIETQAQADNAESVGYTVLIVFIFMSCEVVTYRILIIE